MIDLCYDPLSLAKYILSQNWNKGEEIEKTHAFLDWIYTQETEFLLPEHKGNKKRFKRSVIDHLDGIMDGKTDSEHISSNPFKRYFMFLRIRLLYEIVERDYVKIKLRVLLKQYGYFRRSEQRDQQMRDCILFYHIQPFLRGEEPCDIRDIDINSMVSFRLL